MKIWHSGVTIVLAALLASAVGQFEGRAESKFLDTVLQYLESKEAKMMQNSGEKHTVKFIISSPILSN